MELKQHITDLARDTLETFSRIESVAKEKMESTKDVNSTAFAHTNTFTGTETNQTLDRINREAREGYSQLTREPAIARLILEDENANQKTVYVARKYQVPLGDHGLLASYNAPMGRLASLPIGDAAEVNGVEYTVIEACKLYPALLESGWDSKDSKFDHEELGQQSISSLRALLRKIDSTAADDFDAMLAGEETEDLIKKGLVHEIRRTMGLRDQPILDKFQDEIFRLPLNSRLMIMGPPGTGKTTTLIKRLSQKLDAEFLDPAERRFARLDSAGREHTKSWVMFTPTELLRVYLKDAFAREDVPVSNNEIVTWENYRRKLSRENLGLLQSSTNTGKFILKDKLSALSRDVVEDPISWYEAFRDFHSERLFKQLADGLHLLENSKGYVDAELVRAIRDILGTQDHKKPVDTFSKLTRLEDVIQESLQDLNLQSEQQLKELAGQQYKQYTPFFNELASFIDQLEIEDDEEDDSVFDGEDEPEIEAEPATGKTSNKEAFNAYKKAIRSLGRSRYQKRSLQKSGRTYAIVEWLNERVPTNEELLIVGERASLRNALNRFSRPYRRFVRDVPGSYKAFRKKALSEKSFYSKAPEKPKHISAYELDAVVLLALENSRKLIADPNISRSNNGALPSFLQNLSTMFLNQVFVDEATDFSALQLAAMKNLSSLDAESFCACGDFNQRITGDGIRSKAQLKWLAKDLTVQNINAVYRQSRTLNRLAGELLTATGGDLSALGELPESTVHDGLMPTLIEHCSDIDSTSAWLAERIREIESLTPPLPTTAVLVQNDDQAEQLADALNEKLEDFNLRAEACVGGKSLGEGNNVRVFSIEHIKGLEFEAVFFVGVDELAELVPDLFDKYLYVGFTRAATYLGLTCNQQLPEPLSQLRSEFTESWNS
ncbi:ATP-binding domain-containing protein [Marinobacter salarius]|uniref:ATP-binding domain-containing protein n=1 Tax=Marinobacter salarius TaxID=1420917 RepID=UPI00273AD416|nr:ATP-binding domain-containing protein [Marinobacter salarius]MDP4533490.1 ATP-binding domain-containing protein [Marinobacter salarius]